MNRQEFEDTARRYREELFRMYANQSMNPPPKPVQDASPAAPQAVPANAVPEPEPQPSVQSAVPALPEPLPQPNPQPEPPEESDRPESAPEESADPAMPKRAYTGIIRVHVATAQGAKPVAGAAVLITHITAGEPELISLQTTDQSGNIEAVTVPAPPPSADQRHPESCLYDITAQAAGYYREHSTDVPVFPNVTSVQNFDLIPLPAGADEPLPEGDITYYNNMPQY